MRSIKKVFSGGVSGLSVTFSSKIIETLSSEINAFAIIVPSEFFVIGIDTLFSSFFVSEELGIISEAYVKLDCLSIVSTAERLLSSFSICS